jgi:undecaprenyl-diphosphatase
VSIFQAILLGLIQGLTEFLPVSSSGHMVLLQKLFGIDEGAMFFTVMVHVGTLIAVFVVYRKTIWDMIKHPLQKKVLLIVISTVVTAIIWFAFKKVFTAAFTDANYLGFGFMLTAILLVAGEWAAKRNSKRSEHSSRRVKYRGTIERMSVLQSIGVGVMQGIAIFPGVSRSGSTISGARFFGLKKSDAAEFSFLLSIPAILGSCVLELPDLIKVGTGDVSMLTAIIGLVAAGISGYFAIRFMIKLISHRRLTGFAVYVAILGILILLDQFVTHIYFANPFMA